MTWSSVPSAAPPSAHTRALRTLGPSERESFTAESMWRAHHASDDGERRREWHSVTIANMQVARALARRYRSRGVAEDDLEQVAYLGLVYAVRHFDVTLGRDFLAYAVPTIRGNLLKHFRDQGWTVRPPRRIQQLQADIARAREDLAQDLGRSPRPSEVAEHIDAPVEEVVEALTADGCFTPTSLDLPVSEDATVTLGDAIRSEDRDGSAERSAAEARLMLEPVLRGLDARDRRIVHLRFVRQWTQQEIADDLGVTQMQVSRLLKRIMRDLRGELTHPSVTIAAS